MPSSPAPSPAPSPPAMPPAIERTAPAEARPPVAARIPHAVVSPQGTRTDEYYWLRDDARRSAPVLEYLGQENAYADAVLAPLAGLEQQLFDELTGRLAPDDTSVPVLDRGYWYYRRYEPGREYPVHARRAGSMQAPEQVLLDGNAMAEEHDYFHLGDAAVSPDGARIAYTQDAVGRRQYEMRIKDIATGAVLSDRVANIEAEILWAGDGKTILYIEKDPVTLLSVRVRAHVLGTDAADDRLLYEEQDHSYYLGLAKSRSEQMLFITCSSTEQTEWRYAPAGDAALHFVPVLPREDGHEYDVEHLGGDFIIRTNRDARNFRIVRAPIETCGDCARWQDVIAHRDEVFIERFEVGEGYLAVNERADGLLKIRVRAWGAGADDRLIDAAEPAYAMHLVHTPGIDSPLLRYVYTSLTTPPTTYDLDVGSGERHWRKTDAVLGGFEAQRYVTRQLLAPTDDGQMVPVSLAYRRDTPLDGTAPVYQYGYGAYGLSTDPGFRASWVSLMDRGIIVAIAHVRGGQELGRRWYDEGRLLHKRNSFTDFIAVTETIVREGIGAPDRICAQGGSAGGLLMGAIANMAPQHYRAIVAYVPFVDVVTTMLDESIPLTTNEFDQWGDPREQPYYEYMLSYSPYDNIRAQQYPAMLVFTGLWDSQVQYFEPAKWVARLRARKTDEHPLLFCVDMSAGHGGKSGRYQRYRDTAREFAFLLWQLGRSA